MRLWIAGIGVCALFAASQTSGYRKLTSAELRDKIEGGWAGQMIGVSFGAPTEFKFNQQQVPPDKFPKWKPEMVSEALQQDDLYVDMTFAKVLDDKGIHATTADFGNMFRDAKYRLWHANLAARRALKRGVSPELTGTPKYNAHANDIDFQIEADFVGLMAPGMPQSANDLCLRAGRVMNAGDGIIGGMFISGMYSAAFFETDPRKVVEAGLAAMPPKSPYAHVIADVLAWSKQYPDDYTKVWNLLNEKWDKREPCPEGALRPFNIDAKLNGAYVALGLLYGKGDFGKTVEVATSSGQDSDCNPSSAAGILGVMLGYKNIPDHWKGGIPAIADKKFSYTDFTFRTIVDSTMKRSTELIKSAGGHVEGDTLFIKVQTPKPTAVKMWDDYGSPVERVKADDQRWQWKGDWKDTTQERRSDTRITKRATTKGAEATIAFEGTGVIISGPYLPAGGKAAVYLDGKQDRVVDVCSDEDQARIGEAVWHAFGLKKGKHTVRLVVLGEPGPGSKSNDVGIEDLVIFR